MRTVCADGDFSYFRIRPKEVIVLDHSITLVTRSHQWLLVKDNERFAAWKV